jgi:small-conductance mechanosensitive channel
MLATRFSALALLLVAGVAAHGRLGAQEPAGAQGAIATAPVELDGTVLFRVRGVSSLSAAERARRMRQSLEAVAADSRVPVESLRIVADDRASRIQAGNQVVVTLVDADAQHEQVERAALAAAHLARIREAILSYRAERTATALRQDATRAVIATLVLILALAAVIWMARRADTVAAGRLRSRMRSVGIQSFEVVRAERIRDAVHATVVALRTLIVLAMVVVYLGYVLALFPWTRGLSRDLYALVLNPVQAVGSGIVRSLPGLIFLTVLFFVLRFALKVIRLFFAAVEKGTVKLSRFDPLWAQPTYKAIRVAVVLFGLVVAYPYIPGSQSAAFKGISLFFGVLVSFGSSSAISNIIAGYALIYRRAFKVGDRIRIGDHMGDVLDMRMQVTHLRTLKNEELNIPNSQILASEIRNYSSFASTHGLILHTEVGIGYDTPWRQVEAMLIEAAHRTTELGADPRPYVLIKQLGDFAVTYEINAFTSNVPAMMRLYTALHRNVLDVFNEYGVQIMTPAYEGDPEKRKVVPPEEWYAAPASDGQGRTALKVGNGGDPTPQAKEGG